MGSRTGMTVRVLGIIVLLGATLTAGCGVLGTKSDGGIASSGVAERSVQEYGAKLGADEAAPPADVPQAVSAEGGASSPAQDSLIISTAGITVEVKDLDSSVTAIRDLATKYGATIANLSLSAGGDPIGVPEPLGDGSVQYRSPTPGGATITLRIPADKLRAAQRDIAALGRVLSQTSTQDDVTQQHVDMKARLKNLQAEEARLRTFFLKAKKVSEMLAIEQELARVRGEIESMQAQIAYLERQAAMATLTISLRQPGTLVSPAPGGWGFSAAIREGIRAAASVTRGLITVLLAFSPLIILGLILFVVIRALVRRNRRRKRAQAEPGAGIAASAGPDDQQPPAEG